jgi:hypothetical protein
MVLDQAGSDSEAFLAANVRILDDAVLLAGQLAAKIAGIVVWDGTRRDSDATGDLAEQARRRGIDVYEVATIRVEKA